jgi:hypothetical protein
MSANILMMKKTGFCLHVQMKSMIRVRVIKDRISGGSWASKVNTEEATLVVPSKAKLAMAMPGQHKLKSFQGHMVVCMCYLPVLNKKSKDEGIKTRLSLSQTQCRICIFKWE